MDFDPTTIGTALGSAVAVVAAAFLAIRHRRNGNSKRPVALPPPTTADASGANMALDYGSLPDTRNPMDRVAAALERQDVVLREVQAAVEDDGRWCTKVDLKEAIQPLSDRLTVHTTAIGELTGRMVAVETILEERKPKK